MQTPGNDIDYSIVICTYNPEERILTRCLRSVEMLDKTDLRIEVLLVDNNSKRAVNTLPYVQKFQQRIPGMQCLWVEEQGVKYARMAAIAKSTGRSILYIDTDNEPAPDYLQQLRKLQAAHPQVAAWGPGDVTVDFLDGIDGRLEEFARICFQEKHLPEPAFGTNTDWQSFYPVGTGLCTKSSVLKEYVAEAKKGRFSLPGRKGNQLSSGEDTEMILLAIREGYAAGSAPQLKLNHLIAGSRANKNYLKRLIFGTTSCYAICLLEVFPEKKSFIEKNKLAAAVFQRRAFRKFIGSGMGFHTSRTFDLAQWLALQAGNYYAFNQSLPRGIPWLIQYLGLA